MRAGVLACAAGVLLAVPGVAAAATKPVFMGPPPSGQKAFQPYQADANDYFPRTVTIHAGDSVQFVPVGFHTVDFPPRGGNPLPIFAPTGTTVGGANDAAGNPFWFNGQPLIGLNSQLARISNFGKSLTFNRSARIDSGLPLSDKPKPMTVRFAKTGTFSFFCDVHPGMRGQVHVVSAHGRAPSAKSDAKAVARQVKSAVAAAKRLARTTSASGIIKVGASAPHGVEAFQFFPATTKIPVGTTITFKMPPGSRETHTATTGPGNPETEPNSYLGKLAASLDGPSPDPAVVYPSDPPGGAPANLSPTLHGNGFWSSGAMDSASFTPLPAANSVKFTAPGTYQFYCLIHPFMHATVTVE